MKSTTTEIEGLKLTMTGRELRDRLDERIRAHERRAERWKRELARTPADQTEDKPLLPDHMCEQEMERAGWRVEVLTFVRDHVEAERTYRLSEADLAFGELLPEKPFLVEQADYEEESKVGFELHKMTRAVERLGYASAAGNGSVPRPRVKASRPPDGKKDSAERQRRRVGAHAE
jgi:hypothetical protein